MLELTECLFDMVPFFIGHRVKKREIFAAGIGLDDRVCPGPSDARPQRIAVVSGVAEHLLRRGQPAGQQPGRLRRVPGLPSRELPAQYLTHSVPDQVNFARVPAPAAPDGLLPVFFSAPVPC